jgi:hypothetical protein
MNNNRLSQAFNFRIIHKTIPFLSTKLEKLRERGQLLAILRHKFTLDNQGFIEGQNGKLTVTRKTLILDELHTMNEASCFFSNMTIADIKTKRFLELT